MKTHWKKLHNPDYLGAYDFAEGEERVVTIKTVSLQSVSGPDGKKDDCIVATFTEPFKPMILNATNCKVITKLAGSPMIEDWTGKSFKIVVAKVKAFGDVVDALRIKPEAVKKPELVAESENFLKCRAAVQSGQFTVEQIKSKYSVSAEVEKLLTDK